MPFGFFEEIESNSGNLSGDKINLTKQRDFSLENTAPVYPGVQTPQVERGDRS